MDESQGFGDIGGRRRQDGQPAGQLGDGTKVGDGIGLNQHAGAEFVRAQAAVGCRAAHKALVGCEWTTEARIAAAELGCPAFSKPYIGPALGAWLDSMERTIPRDRVLKNGYREAQCAE